MLVTARSGRGCDGARSKASASTPRGVNESGTTGPADCATRRLPNAVGIAAKVQVGMCEALGWDIPAKRCQHL